MKKKLLILMFAVFITTFIKSQTIYPDVMPNFAGYTSNENFQITWTAGEQFYETITNEVTILTQGFNQTTYLTSDISESEFSNIKITVYPNPTPTMLNIKISKQENLDDLEYFVSDMQGKIISIKKVSSNVEQIDFSNFADNMYFLQVRNKSKVIKTFKIQKNN